jgi:hypothetical protein
LAVKGRWKEGPEFGATFVHPNFPAKTSMAPFFTRFFIASSSHLSISIPILWHLCGKSKAAADTAHPLILWCLRSSAFYGFGVGRGGTGNSAGNEEEEKGTLMGRPIWEILLTRNWNGNC